jgi:hypothetical protein
MANFGSGVCEQVPEGAGNYRRFEAHVASKRTDGNRLPFGSNVIEALYIVNVDEDGRTSEAEVHAWNEALATGEDLPLVAHLCQGRQGFFEVSGCSIFKL